jgi:hypothetical protein
MNVVDADVKNACSGSFRDWEVDLNFLKHDLTTAIKLLANKRSSKQSLVGTAVCCFWLLFNVHWSVLRNADEVMSNFIPICSEFASSYTGSVDAPTLDKMKTTINEFLKGEEEMRSKPKLSQALPKEIKCDGTDERALNYFVETAQKLNSEFLAKLKSFNDRATANYKQEDRAREKACLEEKEGGYDGDFTRVLDYLRGTVFIDVDTATTAVKLRQKFEKVKAKLTKEIGSIERVKIFQMENNKTPPRILINLAFSNNSSKKSIVCEVQVRFALYGFDFEFQNFMHTVYELERKPMNDVNWKPHVLGLTRDVLDKTGLSVDDSAVDSWVKKANLVEVDYLKGQYEDEDQIKIVLTKFKGTRHEKKQELAFMVEYVLDEHGEPTYVPGSTDKYQFQIVPVP